MLERDVKLKAKIRDIPSREFPVLIAKSGGEEELICDVLKHTRKEIAAIPLVRSARIERCYRER